MRVIVRPPSDCFRAALSTHAERDRIDPSRALVQHRAFVEALLAAGATVVAMPAEPDLPDAPFVSDTILALPPASDPEGATALLVESRPAEPSRRAEVDSVAALARTHVTGHAGDLRITAPATLEGGDVIVLGDRVLIGVSARTNSEGAACLADAVRPLGYRPFLCPVADRLHLATAVSAVRPDLLIGTAAGFASIDSAGPEAAPRDRIRRLVIPDTELPGANVLPVAGTCLLASGNPTAASLLAEAGMSVLEVDLGEFTRADGGPTCLVAIVA